MSDFIRFIREQGIIGLAIGFILGGAVSRVVQSFVVDIINPLIGMVFGSTAGLASLRFGTIYVGSFIAVLIDFLIVAAVVYFGFKWIGLRELDVRKER